MKGTTKKQLWKEEKDVSKRLSGKNGLWMET